MFGAVAFGHPAFAQGPAPGAAAQLSATATLSLAASALLTKPAATLAASSTILVAALGGFTKVPAALAAASTVTVGAVATLSQPAPIHLAAHATLYLAAHATLHLPPTAHLAVAATIPFSTAAVLHLPVSGLDKACAHPLPIDPAAPPILPGCWAALPVDPTRAGRRRSGSLARTPPARPLVPGVLIAAAAKSCGTALPIDAATATPCDAGGFPIDPGSRTRSSRR